MKKRAISLLLVLVMVLGLIPVTARAATLNGLVYEVYKDHVVITGYTDDATEVVIPNEIEGFPVTSISSDAFSGRTSLTSITIPESVTSIGSFAFYGCTSLTSVVIPDGVTGIYDHTFHGCTGLISVTIPASVDYIGGAAFYGCDSLTELHVDENNPHYSSDAQGFLFNKEKTKLILAQSAIAGSYTIPEGVTSIGPDAFSGCSKLTDINFPDSVTSIGPDAFSGCSKLTSVDLPDSVTSIGNRAFSECSRLSSITIPNGVTTISGALFYKCKSLTNITIPSGVTFIDYSAFYGCTSLTSVRFQGDAPEFYDGNLTDAFSDVTATVYYPANNPTWTDDVMQDYGGLLEWVSYDPNPFTDVPLGAYYEEPVIWASENNITTGATATTFNPGGECLRAHVVTFLHRAAGNPAPASSYNPFTDVKSSDFFYKPVLWANECNVTNGISANKFGSFDVCNRAQVVTFLWRACGSMEPRNTNNPFVDVRPTDFYYKPVLWAVENGITNGVDATHFGPNAPCNRAQVVTFLFRAFGN